MFQVKNRVLTLVSLSICFSVSQAQSVAAQQTDFTELEKVAREEMRASDIPGAAIAIVRGDKILLARGFGVGSVETSIAVTPDTLFRLGSTTKMFTAAALVQMEFDGKVDFHKPIGTYAPGLDKAVAELTLDHLLSHTAGLLMAGYH